MPNSLKCKVKHLCHNGTITERECDRILKALEQEPFINKPCVSSGVCDLDKNKVLDKIRAEIEELKPNNPNFKGYFEHNVALNKVLEVIDKYKAESKEEKDMTNEELLEMLVLVRDLTEINKNLKKQIAMNEIKISKLNTELNKYQFQMKEGYVVQNEVSD